MLTIAAWASMKWAFVPALITMTGGDGVLFCLVTFPLILLSATVSAMIMYRWIGPP